jgi:hypothetical protein
MSWLENNPLGVALVSACAFLLLASGALTYVWNGPASSGALTESTSVQASEAAKPAISELGPITEYREVTERPVFDESRRPALTGETEEPDIDVIGEVADAPDVRLTGVIITPEARLVTLRPASSGESLIAREGEPLDGEYFGWSVSAIEPRSVVLASSEGGSLKLDLQVNTRRIEEPLKAKPAIAANDTDPKNGGNDNSNGEQAAGENSSEEQPLSRAEEIRQRIAERRAQLRTQSEQGGGSGNGSARPSTVRNPGSSRNSSRAGSSSRASSSNSSGKTAYQSAIQNMINRNNKEEEDDEDGNGGE